MKTPHIHAELIKAWAGGNIIEYYDEYQLSWVIVTTPQWADGTRYRIKPELNCYRVAECRDADTRLYIDVFTHDVSKAGYTHFVRWLGDWVEYD